MAEQTKDQETRIWAVLRDVRLMEEHARVVIDMKREKEQADPKAKTVTLQIDTEGSMTLAVSVIQNERMLLAFDFGWEGKSVDKITRAPVIEYQNKWKALFEVLEVQGSIEFKSLQPLWPYIGQLNETAMRRAEQTLAEMGIAQKLIRPDVASMTSKDDADKPKPAAAESANADAK